MSMKKTRSTASRTAKPAAKATQAPPITSLLPELRELIQSTRQSAAVAVNAALTTLYWQIGVRINKEILGNERAGYGQQIVAALGRQLVQVSSRGPSGKALRHMIRFAETPPVFRIVSALSRKLDS